MFLVVCCAEVPKRGSWLFARVLLCFHLIKWFGFGFGIFLVFTFFLAHMKVLVSLLASGLKWVCYHKETHWP